MKNNARITTNEPTTECHLSTTALAKAVRLSLIGASLLHSTAQAATLEVTSSLDNGTGCTLREAIEAINMQPVILTNGCQNTGDPFGTNDTIRFANNLSGNVISLGGSELSIGNGFQGPQPDLVIDASNLTNPVTVDGSGLSRVFSIYYASVNASNLNITGGASTNGGGIQAGSGVVTLTNCTLSDNSATSNGGAIFLSSGVNLTLNSSSLSNNSAGSNAGAIRASGGSNVSLNNTSVSGNTAVFTGGISLLNNSSLTLNNSSVSMSSGSGIRAQDSFVTMTDSRVEGNNGGGLRAQSTALLSLTRSHVVNNSASSSGGGIFAFTSVSLVDSTVASNISDVQGGGIMGVADLNLLNSTVSDNSAGTLGGGIDSFGGGGTTYTTTITNSTISGNSSGSKGGGVNLNNGGVLLVVDSAIHSNMAGTEGGGIANYQAGVTMTNSTLSGNSSAQYGGGISAYDSIVEFSNSTIANNMAAVNHGGILANNTSFTLSNSIVADNIVGSSNADCFSSNTLGGSMTVDASTIIEDSSCGASLFGDPMLMPLADNGGPTLTHALPQSSIARNLVSATNCPATDQRGEPRKTGDGRCDSGAYETDEGEGGFIIIPSKNNRIVIVPL